MSVLNLSFNKMTSHLCCTTNEGFIIYKLSPKNEKKIYTELNGGVGLMSLLDATNLSVLVGGGDNPFRPKDTIIVWDDNRKSSILEIEIREPIKNTYLTNDKIIIVTERKVRVCTLENGNFLGIKETYQNDLGLCAVALRKDTHLIATLGGKKGELALWKIKSDECSTIQSHDNNIVAIALNLNGSLVATASEVGTNIHIYNTDTGKQVYKLRRGITSTRVFSMAFDEKSEHLACCSSNGTIHIFDISNKEDKTTKNIKSMFSAVKDYLPEYFSSQWSFKQIHVEETSKMICAFDSSGELHIATYDGNYYKIFGKEYEEIKKSSLSPAQK
jgi:WD40 repeat protein